MPTLTANSMFDRRAVTSPPAYNQDDLDRIEARRLVFAHVMLGNDVPDAEALEEEMLLHIREERARPKPKPVAAQLSLKDVLAACKPVQGPPVAPVPLSPSGRPYRRKLLLPEKE